VTAAVGADENDHVSYAGALFDALVADPGLQRLSQWRAPEFPEASEAEIDSLVAKSTEIADSYGVGLTLATDLMMIALGAAMAWNATAERIRNPLGEPEEQRTAVRCAARGPGALAVDASAHGAPGPDHGGVGRPDRGPG
jgi:hypothetical protein